MNKHKLHHALVVLRQIKLWHLLVLLAVMCLATAFLLRQNNLHMITLRNLVQQADEQNQNIPTALTNLQGYVTTHMNTGMGEKGIYLSHSYQRAYDQAVQGATSSGSASSAAYQQADKDCQSLFSRTASFPAYVQCVIDKVAASGTAVDPVKDIKAPSADLYRYNFVSPAWSSDVAGWAVLVTLAVAFIITGRLVTELIIYLLLQKRHRVF